MIVTKIYKACRKVGISLAAYGGIGKPIIAYWWRARPNFGDELNAWLIKSISGRPVIHFDDVIGYYDGDVYGVVGSILQNRNLSANIIWGAGLISNDADIHRRPRQFLAVRGPLTRERVLQLGMSCPEVYGDPALLMPRYYTPSPLKPSAKLGLVAHYKDKANKNVHRISSHPGVLAIDVQRSPKEVIDEICRCEAIASSSLHGLIIALTYGIPAVWVNFSDIVKGEGFKFVDFFQSVNVPVSDPIVVTFDTKVDDLIEVAEAWSMEINLDLLLNCCPFA